MLPDFVKGEWRSAAYMTDYRSERFSDMLAERATWDAAAPVTHLDGSIIAAPGYIWFRFWLLERQQIVEKYFDAARRSVGIYVPITLPFRLADQVMSAADLSLGLWLTEDGRITVFNEAEFDAGTAGGAIDAAAAAHAEQRIRELTIEIGQNLFPPAMVRNFTLQPEADI
jgi:predicted RNA-binding protein associated with RNAse of E/G family